MTKTVRFTLGWVIIPALCGIFTAMLDEALGIVYTSRWQQIVHISAYVAWGIILVYNERMLNRTSDSSG